MSLVHAIFNPLLMLRILENIPELMHSCGTSPMLFGTSIVQLNALTCTFWPNSSRTLSAQSSEHILRENNSGFVSSLNLGSASLINKTECQTWTGLGLKAFVLCSLACLRSWRQAACKSCHTTPAIFIPFKWFSSLCLASFKNALSLAAWLLLHGNSKLLRTRKMLGEASVEAQSHRLHAVCHRAAMLAAFRPHQGANQRL